MDEAFARLEDISVEQTLERLESLFEASGNFPQVNIVKMTSILPREGAYFNCLGDLTDYNLMGSIQYIFYENYKVRSYV